MKKQFFSLVVAIVAATATYAQTSQVATLKINGETTEYYGANALVNAVYAAAGQEGAVITLSSGTFNCASYWNHNGLTIRGAGVTYDAGTQKEPTTIIGHFGVSDSQNLKGLTFEGLNFSGEMEGFSTTISPRFIKCNINEIYFNSTNSFNNATFIHCKIGEFSGNLDNSSMTFINSIIGYVDHLKNCEFTNSIIRAIRYWNFSGCTLKNCVLINTTKESSDQYIKGASTYNCVSLNPDNRDCFKNIDTSTNWNVESEDGSDFFVTYRYGDAFSNEETFELTDEAKSTYLGDDGTQVGIYGGTMPYDPTPTNPQITKFDVNANSSNGKLTVTLDVE